MSLPTPMLGCKRSCNGSLSLPTFCALKSILKFCVVIFFVKPFLWCCVSVFKKFGMVLANQDRYSINKASNGTGSSSKTDTKGLTVPLLMPVCANQQPLQNRMPGNACDRRRWRIKGARVGAAVEIGSADRRARRFRAPQEGLPRNSEPFCPCH